MFSTAAATAATDDRAWLAEMLRVETALARAGHAAGLIPKQHARAIAAACASERFDHESLSADAVASATPVVPLVEELRRRLPEAARPYVHLGATSQDVMDTALVLVARRCAGPILDDLRAIGDRLADLAARHRDTVQIGRTLLRRAVPTSFGAVCATWLSSVDEAATTLTAAREALPLQYGGPVGTYDALGAAGPRMADALGAELDLPVPAMPWHTRRRPIVELASALAATCGALATVATAVALLSQDEIAELAEGAPGASSSMPHKRNPVRSTLVIACAHQAPGLVATILASQPAELQRSAGRWQAEWPTVTALLRLTAAAAAHARTLVASLLVDALRMRANAAGKPANIEAASGLVDRALKAHHDARP